MRLRETWLVFGIMLVIPMYMLALNARTMYHFIVQQLQHSQITPPVDHVIAPSTNVSENECKDFSAYLSSKLGSRYQLDVPSLNAINVGLGGLEAYDLRDPSQYIGASSYDYGREFGEGNLGGVNESEDDDSLDANCDAKNMHEASEEEEWNESLVDSDECSRNDGSDADELLNADLRIKYLHTLMLMLRMMMETLLKMCGAKCIKMEIYRQETLMVKC
ncbi:LOW QUALITY PROTEIN: hypothetical protein Cgig2_003655 [Carnegiea gigantea]|uniref:Uncharacterized protein n=1 Tax=Carnegiea gigantea TaxID=171969 RepID=A0A9Q1GWM0_9CARY|nr:LOW QUALITY PROTEIN: hypothetical protein Cgig2_003655 [Carnegiea gigantea]